MRPLGRPIGDRKTLRVPGLAGAVVVELRHPAGLQPQHVARHPLAPEGERLVQQVERVDVLVADVSEGITPYRQERRPAAERRVRVQQAAVVRAAEQVVVEIAAPRGADHPLRIALADVDRVAPGRVHQQAPAPAAEHDRDGNIGFHVQDPELVGAAPAHDVLAADIAHSIEPLIVAQRKPDVVAAAGLVLRRGLFGERLSGGIRQGNGPVAAPDREFGLLGGQRMHAVGLRLLKSGFRKVGGEHAVAVQPGLGPLAGLAVADAEQAIGEHVDPDLAAPTQGQDDILLRQRRGVGPAGRLSRFCRSRRAGQPAQEDAKADPETGPERSRDARPPPALGQVAAYGPVHEIAHRGYLWRIVLNG